MHEFEFRSTDSASAHYFEIADLPRPAGARTQWLAFEFRSEGMQAHSPGSHFAVALRARFGRDAQGTPVLISGRGITLGDTSLAVPPQHNAFAQAPGFGGARGAQVESFWFGGNFLYRDARILDQGLRDGVAYRVHLHVNEDRWIAFWLADADGRALQGQLACVQDRAEHPVQDDATGVIIALGRAPTESGAWSARFSGLQCGWF